MVKNPRHKRSVMNMQLRQCFARAKPIRLKISKKNTDFSGFFISKKSQKCSKKSRISKSGFKKAKLVTLPQKN